jgi:hypothetical protein
MSRFWKKFLREGQGLFSRETRPGIYLGTFGKHAGWDDHIDDIGLETESLLLAKQILYLEGIAGQINSGEWEKLGEKQCVPGFKHLFVWKRGGAFLMGKIWSSRDGKNRTKFPMIVCAHCMNIPFNWAQIHIWAALDKLEILCKETQSAAKVGELMGAARDSLRRSLPGADTDAGDEYPQGREFIARLDQGKDDEGFHRIVYCVHTQLVAYLSGAAGQDGSGLRPGHIRLPAAPESPAGTLTFWVRFLESQLGNDAPILLALPLDQGWIDATVGEPTPKEFYSLRATTEVLPVASDIPYNIAEEVRRADSELVRAMVGGNLPAEPRPPKKWL